MSGARGTRTEELKEPWGTVTEPLAIHCVVLLAEIARECVLTEIAMLNASDAFTLKLSIEMPCRAGDIVKAFLRQLGCGRRKNLVARICLAKHEEASRVDVESHKVVLDPTRVQGQVVHRKGEKSLVHVAVKVGNFRLFVEIVVGELYSIYELHFHRLIVVHFLQVDNS